MKQPLFAQVGIGDVIAETVYGPWTLSDAVRWAGSQELWEPLHFDRDFARDHGQSTIIASGGYRQAMLTRALTDWLGLGGRVRRLDVRHTGPTLEGDEMHLRGHVTEKSTDLADPWLACDIDGTNQRGDSIMTAHAVVTLPLDWRME